jgi:YD repeat-containing protein
VYADRRLRDGLRHDESAGLAQTQTSTYQYEYDAMGNLTKVTDPLGRITNQSYDSLYRVTQQTPAASLMH